MANEAERPLALFTTRGAGFSLRRDGSGRRALHRSSLLGPWVKTSVT